jgi:phosphocarrier protein
LKAILKVINKNGIHARPSAGIVEVVKKYKSKVTFFHDGEKANAGSIMELLYLAIGPDEEVEVVAEGEDEEKVIVELDGLFKKGFSECY